MRVITYIFIQTALHHSSSNICTEDLVKNGADVNIADINGEIPLHHIAKSTHSQTKLIAIAESLINSNTDVNIRDKYGETPLHHACRHDRVELADLLITFGAAVRITNFKKRPPIFYTTPSSKVRTSKVFCLAVSKQRFEDKQQRKFFRYLIKTRIIMLSTNRTELTQIHILVACKRR